ncbi:hypothetical protein C7382_1017 [Porphyromonas loveana]|uniref:Uncharacterized protein n=1 Tax=Porphyromonas loveana TaxID=1884669 RepID=A0A2U1FSA2_9PORP|nr:hypothetical protein C7382_1017 [Porphyromonas loveana]
MERWIFSEKEQKISPQQTIARHSDTREKDTLLLVYQELTSH